MAIRCEKTCMLLLCIVFCFNSWKLVRSEVLHSVQSNLSRQSTQCLPNEYGENCTFCVPRDSCAGGHYTCDFITGDKVCLPGWSGKSCTLKIKSDMTFVSCPDNHCRNGGSCVSGQCCCVEGFTGILCEIEIIECTNTSCQHGGICKDLIGRYECLCREGYTGDQCQIPPSAATSQTTPHQDTSCRFDTCFNNGTCFEDSMFVYCLCPTWYTGDQCETALRRKPSDRNNTTCPTNYYGLACDKFCIEMDSCTDGHYVCDELTGDKVCKSGYIGEKCDTRMLPHSLDPYCPSGLGCKNDGECFNGTCCCKYNYSGVLCQIQSIGCLSSPCGNNGTCTESHGGFECHCRPGYSGEYCEILSQLTYIDNSSSTIPSVDRTSSIVPVASNNQIMATSTPFLTASVKTETIAATTVHFSGSATPFSSSFMPFTSSAMSFSSSVMSFSSSAMPFSSSVSPSAYIDSSSALTFTIDSGSVLVPSLTENTNHFSISKLVPEVVSSLMVSSSTQQTIIMQSNSILGSSNGDTFFSDVQQTSSELGTTSVYSKLTNSVSRVATNSIDQPITTVFTTQSSVTTHITDQPNVFVTPGNVSAQSVSSHPETSINLTIMSTSYAPSEESQMSSITKNVSANVLHTYLPTLSESNSLDTSIISQSMSIVSSSSQFLPIQTTTYTMTDSPLFLNSTTKQNESMHNTSEFPLSPSQTPSSTIHALNGSGLPSTLTKTSNHQISTYADTSSFMNSGGIVDVSSSQISVSNLKIVPSSTYVSDSIDSNEYQTYSSFIDFKSTNTVTEYSTSVPESLSLLKTYSEGGLTVHLSTDYLKPSSTSIETRSPSSLTQTVDMLESRSSILLARTTIIDLDIISSPSASALTSTINTGPAEQSQSVFRSAITNNTYTTPSTMSQLLPLSSALNLYNTESVLVSSEKSSVFKLGHSVLTTIRSYSTQSSPTSSVISSSLDYFSTSAERSIVNVSPTTPALTQTTGFNHISTSRIVERSSVSTKRLDTTEANMVPSTQIMSSSPFTSTPDLTSTHGLSTTLSTSTTHFLTSTSTIPTVDPDTTRDLSTSSSNTLKQSTDTSSSPTSFPTPRPPQNIVQTDKSTARTVTSSVVSGMQSSVIPQNTPNGKMQADTDALEWWIILIIVLSIVMLGLMLALLVVIVIRKRRSDFRSLEQNPAAITAYDKEHFSIQPEIANPTYETDDYSDDDSVKTDMYIINN